MEAETEADQRPITATPPTWAPPQRPAPHSMPHFRQALTFLLSLGYHHKHRMGRTGLLIHAEDCLMIRELDLSTVDRQHANTLALVLQAT